MLDLYIAFQGSLRHSLCTRPDNTRELWKGQAIDDWSEVALCIFSLSPDFAGIFGVIELPCGNLCILCGSLTALTLRGRRAAA